MRWDESPKFLLIASIASAVLSAALSLAAVWDHPGYNVAASALALLTAILAYRGYDRSTHRRLGRIQREHLVLRLLLWKSGSAPLNYAAFLAHAKELLLLRQVGGGYVFVHRLLREYFISLSHAKESGSE